MGPLKMREAANEITSAFALLGRQTLRLHKWPDATGKFLHLCVTGFDLASIREKPSNHDRYAAATTSYVKQNIGHHEGTPGPQLAVHERVEDAVRGERCNYPPKSKPEPNE